MTGADPNPTPASASSPTATATQSPTIAIENLSRSFGDNRVLEEVSLAVKPGELVGLVGPNGAGKTTLLRTASGALEPDDGTIEIDGVDVNAAPSKVASRLVAVVPQDTAPSFSFPVRDVVAMGRYPHRSRFSPPTDDDRRAVERALERTRTADLADRSIDEVSGGQRQRVIVARAIAQETPALLLDEPTASLDVNHQLETLELVRELVDDGTAAMAAIHDLSLAARYCDRLALLAGGTIRHVGPPEEVLTADAVGDAFDASAVVATDPVSGATSVTALPNRRSNGDADVHATGDEKASAAGPAHGNTTREDSSTPSVEAHVQAQAQVRVHVFGAGPIASSAVARLALAGVRPTVGPLPTGDVAAETASQFDLETFETGPFSAPSASVTEAAIDAVDGADAVVVADPILGDDEAFDRILEAVVGADTVIGVSNGSDRSRSSTRGTSARDVVDPGRVPTRMHESLTTRLETAEVVDLESVVDAVDRELEVSATCQREDDRTDTSGDAPSDSNHPEPGGNQSSPNAERTVEARGDSRVTAPSQDVEWTVEAETDGGRSSADQTDDDANAESWTDDEEN